MKKIFLSILLVVGVATYATAQKSELAEAKKIWGIFQISMSQDPNAIKKPTQRTKQFATGPVNTNLATAKADSRVGRTRAASGSGPRQSQKPAAEKLTFVQKQLVSLNEGLSHIEKALTHDKTKDLPETWAYKALFNATIAAVDSINTENSLKNQKLAEEAIAKTKTLDTKNEEKENIEEAEGYLDVAVSIRALAAYNKKDYNTALTYFNQLAARKPNEATWFLNAGVTASFLEKYPEAIQNFKKVISLNSPDSKEIYNQIINITLEKLKDTTAAFGLLDEALVKYPNDDNFIAVQTDLYIAKGDIEKSRESLKKLIAKDPNKAVYQYLMADTYYKQAFNLQAQRNKIDVKNVKEYNAVTDKMIALMDQSLPFYKKSLEIDPKFVPTLETLKQIYGFKNDAENFNDVKKRLDAIDAEKQ